MTMHIVMMPQIEVLSSLTRVLGKMPTAITPDAIIELIEDVEWIKCEEWESFDDLELARTTRFLDIAFFGPLLVLLRHLWHQTEEAL